MWFSCPTLPRQRFINAFFRHYSDVTWRRKSLANWQLTQQPFPSQMASNSEEFFMSWRHNGLIILWCSHNLQPSYCIGTLTNVSAIQHIGHYVPLVGALGTQYRPSSISHAHLLNAHNRWLNCGCKYFVNGLIIDLVNWAIYLASRWWPRYFPVMIFIN